MKRIFVRGLSRSGGTLMVTVLDAHPDVAMSYEIYEHLLDPGPDGGDGIAALAGTLETGGSRGRRGETAIATETSARLEKFTARALRAGVDRDALVRLLDTHVEAGRGFQTLDERLAFIEAIADEKRRQEGKTHWGMKITSTYDALREHYGDPHFLFMLRDGRDIAASRKLVGQFNQTPEKIAEGWCRQIETFRRFAAQPGAQGRLVRYESLTAEPETELRSIAEFLGLPWSDDLLGFHRKDLSLYRNPTGHLSGQQVNKPISTSSVGRWREDLTADERARFEGVAGDMLETLGYEPPGG